MNYKLLKSNILFLVIVMLGCGCSQQEFLSMGDSQVTDANGLCSFGTNLALGAITARSRNDGYLKSDDEIKCMYFFLFPYRMKIADITAGGAGLTEYRFKYLRCSLNQNMYLDVFQTISICSRDKIVPDKDIKRLLRHLFHSNFLNTDVLVAVNKGKAISKGLIRDQLMKWLIVTRANYELNYYILQGNRYMMRKLYRQGLLSHEEAVYFLGRWYSRLCRLDVSMIEDMEFFQLISRDEADTLMKYEVNQNPILKEYVGFDKFDKNTIMKISEKISKNIRKPDSLPVGF